MNFHIQHIDYKYILTTTYSVENIMNSMFYEEIKLRRENK